MASKKTGIHPFDGDIFPDYLFAPSDTTERPIQSDVQDQPSTSLDGTLQQTAFPEDGSVTPRNGDELPSRRFDDTFQ